MAASSRRSRISFERVAAMVGVRRIGKAGVIRLGIGLFSLGVLFCLSYICELAHVLVRIRKNTPSITGMGLHVSTKQLERPDSNITNRTSSASKIFYCGYPLQSLQPLLFPDFSSDGTYLPGQNSSGSDLILYGMHGGCVPGLSEAASYKHLEQNFKGKTILVNGESRGNLVADFPRLKKFYQLGGPVVDTDRTMKLYYAIIIYADLQKDLQQRIIGAVSRPTWSGKNHKLIYMHNNCASHRQKAALELSSVLALDVPNGKCSVNSENISHVDMESLYNITRNYMDNWKIFENYKYCLVMENAKVDEYITEKLLLAFLGGCLPIYWGTEEVFDIFNKRAFLYYEPGVTVNDIVYLERNHSAYKERMSVPILAHGNDTVQKYFSLQDEVGGGVLKKRIRAMIGLS